MSSLQSLPNALPILFTKGSSYDVGFNIGKCFADRIKAYHDRQGKFLSAMEKFYKSEEGRAHLEQYVRVCEQRFPNYMAELRGTADGADIDYNKILVGNFERELCAHPNNPFRAVISKPSSPEQPTGCTDIILNNGDTKVLGHNEDGELHMNDIDYMVCAEIDEYIASDGRVFPPEKFVAHTYPGMLPGGCFGFNSHGLGYSINTCWSMDIPDCRLGEAFHMRRFLTAATKQELLAILKDEGGGSTTGLGVNAGFLADLDMYSFEVCPNMDKPENKVAMVTVGTGNTCTSKTGPFYCRTNHPILFDTTPLFASKGTEYRYDRVHELPGRETKQDILTMLGDTKHPTYPIYRRGATNTDTFSGTACTSLIDFKEKRLNVYKNNPRDSSGPVISIPMTIFG